MKMQILSKTLSVAALICAVLLSACAPRAASFSTVSGDQPSAELQRRVNAAVVRWLSYTASAGNPPSMAVETEPDRAALCKAFATINGAIYNPNCITNAFAIVGSHKITALETSSDNTILHEVGHALGLWHTPSQEDIMFHAETRVLNPSPTDIEKIRAIFGAPASNLSLNESEVTDVNTESSFASGPTFSDKACGFPQYVSIDVASDRDSAATSTLETTEPFADAFGGY